MNCLEFLVWEIGDTKVLRTKRHQVINGMWIVKDSEKDYYVVWSNGNMTKSELDGYFPNCVSDDKKISECYKTKTVLYLPKGDVYCLLAPEMIQWSPLFNLPLLYLITETWI